jgi:eukaryotic-like serine/threonine-protein kinase
MAEGEEEIIVCYSCGAPMNIAAHPPYSRVVCPSCGTENRVKKHFGPYVLNRRHAIGGMSSVFTATDSTLGREVALKILSEEFSRDEKRITAFEEEARLTASFSHPNVVRVFTTGKAFGRLYIAMEFVPGGHFEHHIRERGRIPEKEILPLAIQVAEGLKGAQAAGLIHRDVKPGNILLDSEGNAKIVDFGLALVTQGGKAKAEEIWATPYYVPPEAIEGGVEDFRADIYAFGATFYHALAGKPPCNEESMATDVLREAKRRIIPLKNAAPELTEETCAVIDRAMAFDPANRFASYDEMISALHTALNAANGDFINGGGATKALRRLESRRRKQRNILLATAAVFCLAAVGGLLAWKLAGSSGKAIPKPVIVAADTAGTTDTTHEIAARYRSARTAMEGGDLRVAEAQFTALLKDNAVQEPTRTWAGLEAVVAALMDGRMNDARKHANEAKNHILQSPGIPGFKEVVSPVLDGFSDPFFFKYDSLKLRGQGSQRHMAFLIAGLSNWERGGLDQALPFLQAVASEESLSKDGVMAWYQKTAEVYLRDHERMKSGALDATPNTPEMCREAIEGLNRLLPLLETKGRARFNVRARQLDLEKLSRVLSNPPSRDNGEMVDGERLLSQIEALAKAYRFSAIVGRLTNYKGDPPGFKRESLLIVSQQALLFLSEIEEDLEKSSVNVPLKLQDGTGVASMEISQEKMLSKTDDGEVREIHWTDLGPDQIIELHRELAKRHSTGLDRMRRHELAVAFDWLSGDRERAVAAAETLGQNNESFKSRWEDVSAGLPK